jgi:hypothetical protein
MSAAAHQPEPIRTPDGLELPANIAKLVDGLPPAMQAQLARDLLAALGAARTSADLWPVQVVVARWRAIRQMVTAGPGLDERAAEHARVAAWVAAGAPAESRPAGVDGPLSYEDFVARYLPHLTGT